jgi:hypothetical protein
MPFLKNDGTVVTDLAVVADKDYDYNLASHNSYGLSVQIAYTNSVGLTASAEIHVSNDGVNFVVVPDTLVSITADGSTMWDLSNSAFKIVRVRVVVSAGSVDLQVTYNSLNLA